MTSTHVPPEAGECTSMRIRPVYLPVGHVAERLCIALVGVSDTHAPWARPILGRPLSSLPNDVGHACVTFGSVVAADFQEWCARGSRAEDWAPPLSGLDMGDWLVVDGLDADDVVRAAISLSFLTPRDVSTGVKRDELAAPRSSDESRFLGSV